MTYQKEMPCFRHKLAIGIKTGEAKAMKDNLRKCKVCNWLIRIDKDGY